MNTPATAPAAGLVGFFGKLPSVGDFVHRRLPAEFISLWDGWLQDAIISSREILGQAWLDHYLAAPMWRFLLAAGVAGPQPWMGVVLPSVDRVGRYFPFTLALPLPGNVDPAETFLGAGEWFEPLEHLAAAALDHQLALAEWDRRLSAIGWPPLVLAEPPDDMTIPLAKNDGSPVALPMERGGRAPLFFLAGVLSAFRRPFSLFSGIAEAGEGRMLLAGEGLPDRERGCALIDCRWAAHGWATNGAEEAPPFPAAVMAGADSAGASAAADTLAAPDAAAPPPGDAGACHEDTLPLPPSQGNQNGRP